jgi:hypothetical protein
LFPTKKTYARYKFNISAKIFDINVFNMIVITLREEAVSVANCSFFIPYHTFVARGPSESDVYLYTA